jgi:hypothetical protein
MIVRLPSNHNRPPNVTTVITFRHTFAYRCTAANQARIAITRGQLLSLYTASETTVLSRVLFGSIQIQKIVLWGTSIPSTASLASDNSVTLIWEGVSGSQREIYADSQSTADVPYLTSRPPRNSSASSWTTLEEVQTAPSGTAYGQGAEVLFSIRAGSGSLCHLHVNVRLMDIPFPISFAATGLTVGVPTYNSLDNLFIAAATHVWDPAGTRQFTT